MSEIRNCQLKIIDELTAESIGSLEVEVSKYTKTVNIKDVSTGNHLSTVSFTPGDGTDPTYKSSPFTYDWEYGNTTILCEKAGYIVHEETILIENEDPVTFYMIPVSFSKCCRLAHEFRANSDKLTILTWLEIDGESILNPSECKITIVDSSGEGSLYTLTNNSPTSYGLFYFSKTPSGLTQGNAYMCKIEIKGNGEWYITYQSLYDISPSGIMLEQKIDSIKSTVEADDAMIKRILGLSQENYYLDQTTYTTHQGTKLLIGGRIRTYSDAVSVGTDLNVIATYIITASWTDDKLQTYKVVKQ